MTQRLTPDIVAAAIFGLEHKKHELEIQINELRQMLGGHPKGAASTDTDAPTRKRKKFSAAARRKMAAAQKARWAAIKGESESASKIAPKPAKRKRKMSAAGRKAISIATKKRWALKKAQAAKA